MIHGDSLNFLSHSKTSGGLRRAQETSAVFPSRCRNRNMSYGSDSLASKCHRGININVLKNKRAKKECIGGSGIQKYVAVISFATGNGMERRAGPLRLRLETNREIMLNGGEGEIPN